MHGGKGQGGERFHRAIAKQVKTRRVIDWILHVCGFRQIYIAGANQVLAMHKGIRDLRYHAVRKFPFYRDAYLMDLGHAEVVRKSRNITLRELQLRTRRSARIGQSGAVYQ